MLHDYRREVEKAIKAIGRRGDAKQLSVEDVWKLVPAYIRYARAAEDAQELGIGDYNAAAIDAVVDDLPELWQWGASRYFKILLNDVIECHEEFRDHMHCDEKPLPFLPVVE